jgi:hypothetical protein
MYTPKGATSKVADDILGECAKGNKAPLDRVIQNCAGNRLQWQNLAHSIQPDHPFSALMTSTACEPFIGSLINQPSGRH